MIRYIFILKLLIAFSISAHAQSSTMRMQIREKLGEPSEVSDKKDTFMRNDDTLVEVTYNKDDEPCEIHIKMAEKVNELSNEDAQKRWKLRGEYFKKMVALADTLVPLDNRGRVVACGQNIGNCIDEEATEYEKVLVITDKNACYWWRWSVSIKFHNAACPKFERPSYIGPCNGPLKLKSVFSRFLD